MSKEMNIEKAIKNLNEIVELVKEEIKNQDENITAILDLEDLKSLQIVLKNQNRHIQETDLTSVYLKGVYDEKEKWINKIKEKKEVLSPSIKWNNSDDRDYAIRNLEELLQEKR